MITTDNNTNIKDSLPTCLTVLQLHTDASDIKLKSS